MGLSSFFNPDILIGMGQARQKERENLLSQEAERRKSGTQLLSKIFESPDLTPEAREVVLNKLATATMLEPGKPDPKGLFSLDDVLNVRPQVGRSVSRTQSQELPDVGANQYGLTPSNLGLGASELRAPEAPQDYRRSGFYSPEERQNQEIDAYRRQQGVMTEEQIKRDRAKQQAELEFNTLNPPKPPTPSDFTLSPGQTRYGPDGRVIANIPDSASSSVAKSLQESEVVLKDGKRVMAFFNPDPSQAGYYIKGPDGKLQDITAQVAGQYRQPPAPSATIQIDREGRAITNDLDKEVGYALDRATNNMTPGRKLAVMSTVQRMVKNGDTAAARDTIKQAATESESPVVQNNIRGRREAVAALGEIKSMLSQVPQNLIVGTVEDTVRRLGLTRDPRYVKIATRLTTLAQAYRKAITGAQFSQQESQEYTKVFPSYSNTVDVNTATIDAMMDAMNLQDSIYWTRKLGPGWSDSLSPISSPSNASSEWKIISVK